MNRVRHAIVVVVLSVGVLGTPAAAHAETANGGRNNVVVVHNLEDGKVRARSKAVVTHNPTDSVRDQNYAEAYASCTGCLTVAAAVQVVLVEGNPTDFQPVNAAVAVNDNCHSCQTFAYANQVVLSPNRPVRLSDGANEQIDMLSDQVAQVVSSSEDFPQMSADLDSLTSQIVAVVQADIQRAGSSANEEHHRDLKALAA